ncbi:hypothetical protein RRG08_003282 [Elysia crispata]|uniref:Uncharacterized protein n=1 Tax=Elysia crispata TaxID=231223 RepID=A0AAE0YKP4_9GAST|nr:hypothetical protein RRG08_003282 [Elysia crispata]
MNRENRENKYDIMLGSAESLSEAHAARRDLFLSSVINFTPTTAVVDSLEYHIATVSPLHNYSRKRKSVVSYKGCYSAKAAIDSLESHIETVTQPRKWQIVWSVTYRRLHSSGRGR